MNNKVEPNNQDAEKSVLSSMLMSKYALQKCCDSLLKEEFYNENHGKIFESMKNLNDKGVPVDITTLSAELDRQKVLKQVGDIDYLSDLNNFIPSAANIDEYINIVESNYLLRRMISVTTKITNDCYNSTLSVADILDQASKDVCNVAQSQRGSEFRSIQEVLTSTQKNIEELVKNQKAVTGTSTGFNEIDKITAGLHGSELTILAARPGMGKTAMGLNIATNVAIYTGKPVIIYNLEMTAEQLAMRMISSVGQIDNNKLKTGQLENQDWKKLNEAFSRLGNTKIFIGDTPGITIREIRSQCRRLKSQYKDLGLILIDYLQLITAGPGYTNNRQQEVSDISRSLKTMSLELNVPVIAMAQLSRSVEGREDKRPILSDLRESGSIEQDADLVAFLHSEDYYNRQNSIDQFTSKMEYIIAKHRNGSTATINLAFKKNTSTFQNFITQEEPNEN